MQAMRNAIFAVLALGFLPSVAAAQNDYFGVIGGYNMAQDFDGTDVEAEGLALGLVYGRELDSGLRIEGELGYRFVSIESIGVIPTAGRATNLSLMLNLIYELNLDRGYSYGGGGGGGGGIRPYLGIGGGGTLVTLDGIATTLGTTDIDDDSYAYTYQFLGGVGFEVTSDSILSLDYRHIVTDNGEFTDTAGNAFKSDFLEWTVMMGLRTRF